MRIIFVVVQSDVATVSLELHLWVVFDVLLEHVRRRPGALDAPARHMIVQPCTTGVNQEELCRLWWVCFVLFVLTILDSTAVGWRCWCWCCYNFRGI